MDGELRIGLGVLTPIAKALVRRIRTGDEEDDPPDWPLLGTRAWRAGADAGASAEGCEGVGRSDGVALAIVSHGHAHEGDCGR